MLFALSGIVVPAVVVATTGFLSVVFHVMFSIASITGGCPRFVCNCRLLLMRFRAPFSAASLSATRVRISRSHGGVTGKVIAPAAEISRLNRNRYRKSLVRVPG